MENNNKTEIENKNDFSVTTFDFFRHGEPEGGNRFRGTVDSALTDKGVTQLERAFKTFQHANNTKSDYTLESIISSPRQRCATMAKQWAEKLNIPLLIEPELREINFGHWEGKTVAEVEQQSKEQLENYWQHPNQSTPHGGESLQEFHNRIIHCWQDLQTTRKAQHSLIVTHGGVIRSIIGDLLGIPLDNLGRLEVPHASWSRIRIYHSPGKADWPQLVFHNQATLSAP